MFSTNHLKLFICIAGIYFFYIWYAIVQERITKARFGPNKEVFPSIAALVLIQCLQSAFAGWLGMRFFPDKRRLNSKHDKGEKGEKGHKAGEDKKDKPAQDNKGQQPHSLWIVYALISFTYVGAMLFSNYALKFVDYPTQVIAKSCKPIPVMVSGLFINRKRYPLTKYVLISLVAIGISLFMYNPKEDKGAKQAHFIGYAMLCGSLLLDGVTGPTQEWTFSTYNRGSNEMMAVTNLGASLYIFIAVLLMGQIPPVIDFMIRFPSVLSDILLFSVASSLGQAFIYYTVEHYGSLVTAVITTTRKFLTVLASVIWYRHDLSLIQWLGVILVFSALLVDGIGGPEALRIYLFRTPRTQRERKEK